MTPRDMGIPEVILFEDVRERLHGFEAKCFYDLIEFRAPKKGEHYLSGAIVMAYKARNDLDTPYWVVKPTYYAKDKTISIRGDEIES